MRNSSEEVKLRAPEEILKEIIGDEEDYSIAIELYKAYITGGRIILKEKIKEIIKKYLEEK
ncbi:MAG: hypothetical protein DRN04_00070 [Thermoprotei archaeon]|nr:MAG: hypothetical protein DRN04_00070 [Thermoprotei archaeon]